MEKPLSLDELSFEQFLREGNIIKGIEVIGTELDRQGNPVFFSRIDPLRTKIIIYPNDDLIRLGEIHDLVVNRLNDKSGGRILHCEVYHELAREDLVNVRLSEISQRNEFMFHLHGYLGFLKRWGDWSTGIYRQLSIGNYVRARVKSIKQGKKDKLVHAVPLKILAV